MSFYTKQIIKTSTVSSSYEYEKFLQELLDKGNKIIAPSYITDSRMGYTTDRAVVLVEIQEHCDTGPM